LEQVCRTLAERGVEFEPLRYDELTGRRFVFFRDPDDLPIELYEESLIDQLATQPQEV
jgi:glyoxylase I family protein